MFVPRSCSEWLDFDSTDFGRFGREFRESTRLGKESPLVLVTEWAGSQRRMSVVNSVVWFNQVIAQTLEPIELIRSDFYKRIQSDRPIVVLNPFLDFLRLPTVYPNSIESSADQKVTPWSLD